MIPQREVSRSACHRCSTIRLANRRPKMKPYDARLTAFTPKLVTVLGEGYTFDRLRRDSIAGLTVAIVALPLAMALRSEEHTSELQSLMRISYAVFCLKQKNNT